ncbi:unnamed protein product [Mytilus coruscus]|uniref:Uncharacterized protein n=1 Tax=Mytilus coruscus TaxID=42192 RepID=A0A6J8CRV4_MYTCO|nr:unnamed protein product [Mytilus coruscus]
MSEIPGRDTSFIRQKTPIKTPVGRLRTTLYQNLGITQKEILFASTQTVVVLAELAADSSQLSVPDLDCSGFCTEQPINIQYEEAGHIHMEDMASDAMISIMKYIYGGLVSVTQSCLSDVVKLADREKEVFSCNTQYIYREIEVFSCDTQYIYMEIEVFSCNTQYIYREIEVFSCNTQYIYREIETASPNKTSVESLLKQLWSDSEEEEDDGQGHRKSGEDSGMEQELFCSQSSYSENQKSPVMSGQMSDGIKNSHLNQISRYENKTNFENLDTESASNSPLKYVQENFDYSHSKSGAKTVKNTSLIFENDELEV